MNTKTIIAITMMAGGLVALAQTNSTFETATALETMPSGTNAVPVVPVLQIDAGKVTGNVSSTLYGLMTEEINFSYEGGLYGELIRNRTFKANARNPVFWDSVGNTTIALLKRRLK